MDQLAVSEIVAPRAVGRRFGLTLRAGLADCAPSARIRLDAIADWLQEIAFADVEDAGLAESALWVVRRTRICVSRFPRFAERLRAETWCSGIGRAWAERRTRIGRPDGDAGEVEAVSLWVHLNPVTRRPMPFADSELAVFRVAAGARKVSARLRHPSLAPDGEPTHRASWRFRATDCDLAHHVNNAAYWLPLEEELLAGPEPLAIDTEIEYRTPSQPGEKEYVSASRRRWITDRGGETHASIALAMLRRAGNPGVV